MKKVRKVLGMLTMAVMAFSFGVGLVGCSCGNDEGEQLKKSSKIEEPQSTAKK